MFLRYSKTNNKLAVIQEKHDDQLSFIIMNTSFPLSWNLKFVIKNSLQ